MRAFERVVRNPPDPEVVSRCNRYLPLLRSLAYDPTLFERCAALMVSIAEATNIKDDEDHEAVRIFASLFPIYFSGTHATIEQRLALLKNLLLSPDVKKRTLGVAGLRAALEAVHFTPGGNFDFGAHSRDYGSWPRNRNDIERWFSQTLRLAEEIACSDQAVAPRVADTLSRNSVAFGALRRCTTILSASSTASQERISGVRAGSRYAKPCIMTAVASLRRSLIGLHGSSETFARKGLYKRCDQLC